MRSEPPAERERNGIRPCDGGEVTTAAAFEKARAEGRAALVGYLPAGYPSVDGAIDAFKAMIDSGVDIVEVGLPYSDPLMDGPVIQTAVEAALRNGANTGDVLRTVEAVAAATDAPTLVMSYWNPIDRYGVDRFARDLAAAGGAGVITPDLIPDEAGDWLPAARRDDLDTVFLVAPSSTDERIALTTEACRGFVYAASTMGVTGTRDQVGGAAAELVARTRKTTGLPVAVGLGVSDAAQAAEVAGFADGVIVGSAFVRCLLEADDAAAGARTAAALAGELARGVRHRP
ncbi:tryptophan synthase subunit alpha [Phytoactinopolyspora sp. XMNu-373]|uniref:Tryptophan synthase alpha chain n=1 Tax=Phytoactinopolyspora mesophila TaxID=2650750 RepID=A0A7K3LWS4_9ACTN|nr:tryptophan synthase subunit alpha [Phytoactinopolyspora mesophila]NDL55466.1 tryptophan synthase subunit alpha [Phytoactinopolyspora mesophila]